MTPPAPESPEGWKATEEPKQPFCISDQTRPRNHRTEDQHEARQTNSRGVASSAVAQRLPLLAVHGA